MLKRIAEPGEYVDTSLRKSCGSVESILQGCKAIFAKAQREGA